MIRMPYQKQLKVPITFPAILSKSRDYNSIELLLYTVFNYFYELSEESKNIHNPKRCDVDLLPLLADYYRYQYTDVKDINLERQIISAVPELHHNKATTIGIDNALALSKVDKSSNISIPWFYDSDTNTVSVVIFKGLKTYKLLDLLKLVLPLGTKVLLKSGQLIQSSEEIKLHSWTEVNYGPLKPNKQWYVTPNNTWLTTWNPDEKSYHTYIDYQYHIGDDNMDIVESIVNESQVIGLSNNTPGTRVGNTEITKEQEDNAES